MQRNKKIHADLCSPFDLIVDLIVFPRWLWRRICPASGKVIDVKINVAILGQGWAVKSILIKSPNKESCWFNCEINPSTNVKIGQYIKRRFKGKFFTKEPYKKIHIEIY